MKVINDYPEFRARTALLRHLDFEFLDLDIVPDTQFGIFGPKRLPDLVAFCKNNREYHIVSFLKHSVDVNTAVENATFYMLAQGDKDPHLMYVPKMSAEVIEELRIRIFDRD